MFKKIFLLMLTALVSMLGGGGNVMMAVGGDAPTGVSDTDTNNGKAIDNGVASQSSCCLHHSR